MHASTWIEWSPYLAAFFFALTILLSIVMWSHRRHRNPKLRVQCMSSIERLVPSLAGLSLSTAVPGNSVEVLENSAFFDVLINRIDSAKGSVHFETFLWEKGALENRVAEALADRAKAGVKVRVLLDGTGSRKIGKGSLRRMQEAGC
jgi:cardiolipin synthase